MKYVIEIGQYSSEGNFSSSEWSKSLGLLCNCINYLVIYSSQGLAKILGIHCDTLVITEIDDIEETCGYRAYKIYPKEKCIRTVYNQLNFHPDYGISHCYGYDASDRCIFSLETNDYRNFLVVENANNFEIDDWIVVNHREVPIDIKEEVDDLIDNEDWMLLRLCD